MKGQVIIFKAADEAVLEEFEIPLIGSDEVLIECEYTVISAGTEIANFKCLPNTGTYNNGFPFYPGYCGSGRIVEAGSDVKELQIGDRVIVKWGGHRSHVKKQYKDVLKIEDDSIDMLDASFAHIASFSFLGVRRLKLEIGESAMIVGMGILGVFALQVAVLSGAIPVVVTDFDPARRDLAIKLGAMAAFSPDDKDLIKKVHDITGGGANAIVEVTGVAAALQQSLECVARMGRISLLGCTRISDVPIDFYQYVHRRGVSLIGANTFTRRNQESAPGLWTEHDDYGTFLKFLAAGKIQPRTIISEILSPRDASAIYTRLAEEKNPPLGIVFDWKKL